ncbi:MAG: hypothetical protein QGH39_12320 [Candidatus Thermoplasmatota archaeon]|jgi:hypothetical protein|nr:hypothetical protein [Candidatus Thermoplasmatota archaeon]MDP7266331.1 hypothetical protein [Candidatus Thermoplasmatota archaeon]
MKQVSSAPSASVPTGYAYGLRFREHCQAANLAILSRLDGIPAGKSDEPAGVIEIRTIDNMDLN